MAGEREFVSKDGKYMLNENGIYYRREKSNEYVLAEDNHNDHYSVFHEKNKSNLKPEFLLWDNWTGWNVASSSDKKSNRKRRNSFAHSAAQTDDNVYCTIFYKSSSSNLEGGGNSNSYSFAVLDLNSFLVKKYAKIETTKNVSISDVRLVYYPNIGQVFNSGSNFLLAVCNNMVMELVYVNDAYILQRYEPLEHHTCVALLYTMQVCLKNSELTCTDVLVGTFVSLLEENSSVKSYRLQFFYYRYKKKTGFSLLHSYNVPNELIFSFYANTNKLGLKSVNVRNYLSLFAAASEHSSSYNLLGVRSTDGKGVSSNCKFPNLLTFFYFSQSEMGFLHSCSFDDIVYSKCGYFAEFQTHQNFLTLYMVLKRRQTVEVFSILTNRSESNISKRTNTLKDALFEVGFFSGSDSVRIVRVNSLSNEQKSVLCEVTKKKKGGEFRRVNFAMSGLVLGKNIVEIQHVLHEEFTKNAEENEGTAPLEVFLNGKGKIQFIAEEEEQNQAKNVVEEEKGAFSANKTAVNSLNVALKTSDQKLIDQILKGLPADVAANTVASMNDNSLTVLLNCLIERILARPRRVNELVKWLKAVADEFSKKNKNNFEYGKIEQSLRQIEMFAELKTFFYPSICRIKSRLENSLDRFKHMEDGENDTAEKDAAAPLFSFTHEESD